MSDPPPGQVQGWGQPKDQDIAEAKALMAAAGYAGWGSIEQDVDPARPGDLVANARASIGYLRGVGIAQ